MIDKYDSDGKNVCESTGDTFKFVYETDMNEQNVECKKPLRQSSRKGFIDRNPRIDYEEWSRYD